MSGLSLVFSALVIQADEARPVNYSRDIRPILSNNCFKCHGPDMATREADLRLDTIAGATADLGGRQAVTPGAPDSSEVMARITASDPDVRMPPPDRGLALTEAQVEIVRRWIAGGAHYEQHWSFLPITRPRLPNASWDGEVNAIDAFVRARLNEARVTPSPEADRATLIRRVYLDLLGLPPTADEVERFLSDASPMAYERLVDRLLASPHFGERWGRHWLDQARYADTNGYSIDSERTMWPYRDWVIAALNDDLPFDQFTMEQLAGDLLPSASPSQLVATGFHRNTLINQEGGTDREQFRNEAVVDRVNTTGAVWLGLTVGCCQCHDHKYDPLSQREYYQLFAFFNSSQDVNSTTPTLSLPTPQQQAQLDDFDGQIKAARAAVAEIEARQKEQAAAAKANGEQPAPQSDPQREQLAAELKKLQDARNKYAGGIPAAMIMRDLPQPRATHVLLRGDFLRKGDAVEPNGPSVLPPLSPAPAQRTRLDLARWLVSRENPLTARVTVNRIWLHCFGQGLVETENDFGLQGTPPTHPELLDWLAAEFIEGGWSQKHLLRLIVTSATYRQASHMRPELTTVDPLNKLLARQSRLRVDAEIVRDLGLAVSGLLHERIGGPSVYPPQPGGLYVFTQRNAEWPTSQGGDRYRRGLYTFFMRSVPYPLLTTFDTPRFNTTCTARVRSNTPLQSLTLANDQSMLEIARALGRRLAAISGDDAQGIREAYTICFARAPDESELDTLTTYLASQRAEFAAAPDDAQKLVDAPHSDPAAIPELAAWTSVARVLLNLDEFITRE